MTYFIFALLLPYIFLTISWHEFSSKLSKQRLIARNILERELVWCIWYDVDIFYHNDREERCWPVFAHLFLYWKWRRGHVQIRDVNGQIREHNAEVTLLEYADGLSQFKIVGSDDGLNEDPPILIPKEMINDQLGIGA